jgi:8-oxo-dGTP pyrophosphatase MutT (NUDIX family)
MRALTADQAASIQPRPAATTLILRDGGSGLEVLMARRSMQASFMPGAYVFPGGAVDEADASAACLAACDESVEILLARIGDPTQVGDQAAAFAVAALRETFEECGLWLGAGTGWAPAKAERERHRARLRDGAALAGIAAATGLALHTSVLQPWSHWVTPLGLPKRFDTLFFVAPCPGDQNPREDAGETTSLEWVCPPEALARHAEGGFHMEFATVTTVRSLLPFAARGVGALLEHARGLRDLGPLHPRLRVGVGGGIEQVLLPGEPGYDEVTLPAG